MLSSTSVSSIGNIHRRVIVFPFVVPSSGSVWCSERSRGGVRVDLAVSAIWMADGFFFTSEHSARERRTPLRSFETGFDGRLSLDPSYVSADRCWTLIRVRGPVVYDDVPKELKQN